MVLVLRMKWVTRLMILAGSLVVWAVALTLLNDAVLELRSEEVILGAAVVVGIVQTWLVAFFLGT